MPNPEDRIETSNSHRTPEQKSYEQGYTEGRNIKNDLQYQRERAAENNGPISGLTIGGILATLLCLGAAYYYWWQPSQTPTTIINTSPSPAASTPASPQVSTKVIERTVEKAVPAPPPKVVEVPKPVLVPGTTKIIEVPKPFAVPVSPAAPTKLDPPQAGASKDSSTSIATPAAKDNSLPSPNNPLVPAAPTKSAPPQKDSSTSIATPAAKDNSLSSPNNSDAGTN
jgi:hypothetical protein